MKKYILLASFLLTLSLPTFAQTNKVLIETEYGNIVLSLYDNTPQHRDNMVKLVNQHFFDSLLFHRVIKGFVIQGGDPGSKTAAPGVMLGNGETGYRVPAEINDTDYHKYGALGMARDNNPEKASSGCQFYIVTGKKWTDDELTQMEGRMAGRKFSAKQREDYKTIGGTPMLDGGYTVYGEVITGMDVVNKISDEPGDQANRPNKDIRMTHVRLLTEKEWKKMEKQMKKDKK